MGAGLQGQDLKVFGQTQNLSRAQKSHNFLNFIRTNYWGRTAVLEVGPVPRLKHLHSDGADLVYVVDIS